MNESLEELYRSHRRLVFGLCRRILGSEGEPEDAVQDVFLNAGASLKHLRPHSNTRAWLSTIAINVSLKHVRTRRRRLECGHADVESCSGDAGECCELRILLAELLKDLDPCDARIVIEHWLHGVSQDVVAQQAGVSRRAVVKRIARIRARARDVTRPRSRTGRA